MKPLLADDLVLEPLEARHAPAMFEVLKDPGLYTYLDHPPPPNVDHLRGLYTKLESRKSPDGGEHWLNWIVIPRDHGPVGYVQSTVTPHAAWIAYVFASLHWGRGYATRAAQAMIDHLERDYSVLRFLATVEAENAPSIRVLLRLGFKQATGKQPAEHELRPSERFFIREGDA